MVSVKYFQESSTVMHARPIDGFRRAGFYLQRCGFGDAVSVASFGAALFPKQRVHTQGLERAGLRSVNALWPSALSQYIRATGPLAQNASPRLFVSDGGLLPVLGSGLAKVRVRTCCTDLDGILLEAR